MSQETVLNKFKTFLKFSVIILGKKLDILMTKRDLKFY